VEGGGIDIKRDSPDCTLHHLPHTSTLSIKKKKGRNEADPGSSGWRSREMAIHASRSDVCAKESGWGERWR
jgi:hypothetical protein